MMVQKAVQRLHRVEKKCAEMAAKVEQARKALATAEHSLHANEKALAEARSHFHMTQQEHFARFPSGCPLDNDVCAGRSAVLVAAATRTPAGTWQWTRSTAWSSSSPEDIDQETKHLWQQLRELKKRMLRLRGEMGAKA